MVNVITAADKRRAKTRLVRFTRNTSYRGRDEVTHDYGPDYEEDTAEVLAHEAEYFVTQGRALFADEDEGEAGSAVSDASTPPASPSTNKAGGAKAKG
jgi:hypothetical protein